MAIESSSVDGQQGEALGGVVERGEQRLLVTVSPNTDAVSARVSGVRLVEHALLAGQVGVQAVAELVGQRGDVAGPAGPVEEHVGVVRRARCRRRTRRAACRAGRRVDPRLAEEALHGVGQLGREAT